MSAPRAGSTHRECDEDMGQYEVQYSAPPSVGEWPPNRPLPGTVPLLTIVAAVTISLGDIHDMPTEGFGTFRKILQVSLRCAEVRISSPILRVGNSKEFRWVGVGLGA